MMSGDVRIARPQDTIAQAAGLMTRHDVGSLPVGDGDRLVGFLTDRDIVVRAVAGGLGPDTPVREVMSTEVKYCFDDEDIDDVARNMAQQQVRRLPVLDRDKRLVGIVSLGNFADSGDAGASQDLLRGVAAAH